MNSTAGNSSSHHERGGFPSMEQIWASLTLSKDLTLLGSLVGVVAVALVLYRLLRHPRGLPPGPRPWPLVGNMMLHCGDLNRSAMTISRDYGPVACMWYGPRLVVVLGSLDVINEAFVRQSDVFSSRPEFIHTVNMRKKLTGTGVIWQNGEPWKLMRRLMLQTMRDFGVGKRSLEERIQEEVTVVSNRLEAAQGSPYGAKADLQYATINIICGIVFGRRFDYSDPDFRRLNDFFSTLFSLPLITPRSVFPILSIWTYLKGNPLAKKTSLRPLEFLQRQIKEHEDSFDADHPRDLVDVYLKAQRQGMQSSVLTTQNLQRGVMDIFVAGGETTSTTLNWALLSVIVHPEVQRRCQDEIDKEVGQGRMVAMTDKSNLPYVSATILEVMRLWNVVPISLPHCTTKETKLRDFTIPANTLVLANMAAAHLDPEVWSDPTTFRPERFLDGQGQLTKKTQPIPFSAGPRICLGESLARMEIFLFFANLLQRFSFSAVEGEELRVEGDVGITHSPRPYTLVATRR